MRPASELSYRAIAAPGEQPASPAPDAGKAPSLAAAALSLHDRTETLPAETPAPPAGGPLAWLRARLDAPALDRRLAAGVPAANSPALARRAAALTSPRGRRRLAAGLRRALDPTPPRGRSSAIPVDRPRVDGARPPLAALLGALQRADPIGARGAAIVSCLLCDGTSALYLPSSAEPLADIAQRALSHLHDQRQAAG